MFETGADHSWVPKASSKVAVADDFPLRRGEHEIAFRSIEEMFGEQLHKEGRERELRRLRVVFS